MTRQCDWSHGACDWSYGACDWSHVGDKEEEDADHCHVTGQLWVTMHVMIKWINETVIA
jgi:hypothetical protein